MQRICWYLLVLLSSALLLSACSSSQEAYYRSLKLALSKPLDVNLGEDLIKKSRADLIYVKKGEQTRVALALAFIEQGHYKWVSADHAVVVEQGGRILKTLGLEQNLDFVTAETADPLLSPATISDNTAWQYRIDIDSKQFGLALQSTFHVVGKVMLDIEDRNIETVLIEEQIRVTDSGLQQPDETQWLNQYWLHLPTGQLLRSHQKLIPDGQYFDIEYVSRALRL